MVWMVCQLLLLHVGRGARATAAAPAAHEHNATTRGA